MRVSSRKGTQSGKVRLGPPQSERAPRDGQDRTRMAALKGKSIVVVGYAIGPHHREYLELAKELGVKVQLLYIKDCASAIDIFTTFDPTNVVERVITVEVPPVPGESDRGMRRRIATLAFTAAEQVRIRPDGIVTFIEEEVEVAAMLARWWGLPHMPASAVRNLRDKGRFRALMQKAGLPTPAFARIRDAAGLQQALAAVGFPAVLKPASGTSQECVVRVDNPEQARQQYKAIAARVAKCAVPGGNMSFDSDAGLVLERYLEPPPGRPQGGEVDIDFALKNGKLLFASVTDNHPTLAGTFAPTGLNLPSQHSFAEQDCLVDLAVKTALAAGAHRGIFHFEGMLTKDGKAFLIEANPRVGGRPVWPINREVWGVDLIKESFMLAANIAGSPHCERAPGRVGSASMKPKMHIYARVAHVPRTGIFAGVEGWENVLRHPGIWPPGTLMCRPGSSVFASELCMDRAYIISTQGASFEEAKAAYAELSLHELKIIMEA